MKKLTLITVLVAASLSIASAKSYEVVLQAPATAGHTELRAGHYRVKVNGGFAEFFNMDTERATMVPVKVEASTTKFDTTAVESKTENGTMQIQSIELQDSNSVLEF